MPGGNRPDRPQDGARGAGELRRQTGGDHPGIDGARGGRAHRDPGEDRQAEHVVHVALGERAPGLLDQDRSAAAGHARGRDRAPQRQVARVHDHHRPVHHFEQGPGRRFVGGAGVDHGRARPRREGDGQSGAGLRRGGTGAGGRAPGRQEVEHGRHLDRQPVEGVGRRLRTGGEPGGQARLRVGGQAEDRGLIAGEVGEAGAGRVHPGQRQSAGGGEH